LLGRAKKHSALGIQPKSFTAENAEGAEEIERRTKDLAVEGLNAER
jgi:hypothetical protein